MLIGELADGNWDEQARPFGSMNARASCPRRPGAPTATASTTIRRSPGCASSTWRKQQA